MIYILAIAGVATIWRYGQMVWTEGTRVAGSNLASAFAAGSVAGLVFGVTARIAMRLVAIGMDVPLRLTVSGSVAVVVIFAGLGLGLAFPYVGLFRAGNRGHPLVYALTLTVVTLQPFIRAAAQDVGVSAWDVRVIIGATLTTVLLWFPYVLVLECIFSRVVPWISQRRPQCQ